jgi:hypothetical protein
MDDKKSIQPGVRYCISLTFMFLIISANHLFSQADTSSSVIQKLWKFDGTFAFTLNESTFTNWVAGGDNQISSTTMLKPHLTFDNKKWSWETSLDIRHGIQKIESDKAKKSDDILRFETKVGKRISKNWKFSSLYTINTQARPSYNGEKLVSAFMAPC